MQALLYRQGRLLEEVCPEELRPRWQAVIKTISAYHRSFLEARINFSDFPLQQLIPERVFLEYQELKEKVEDHVLNTCEKPANYDFLLELNSVIDDVEKQKLLIDTGCIKATPESRDFLKKIKKIRPHVSYNMFGTKTGRLTTNPGSFPILTLKKENRSIIKPQKDCFLEMDFNAFELRVILALMGKGQPREDLHDWNTENVYRGLYTREQAKKRMFAWLYNPNSDDKLTNRYYDRGLVKDRFFSGGKIKTIFNREIESDDYHAFNYIIQSTASDLFLQQAIKIHKLVERSNIAFMIHDSLVLDFHKSELDRINQIREIFSRTIFGDFPISMKVGKNYGEMKEWKL